MDKKQTTSSDWPDEVGKSAIGDWVQLRIPSSGSGPIKARKRHGLSVLTIRELDDDVEHVKPPMYAEILGASIRAFPRSKGAQ